MKLKDKFNLSLVAGFFVGVIVTVAFNWIVFKDPKRVTAPGVAALVAGCTFSLALYTAMKVKKWMDIKHNDLAYKHTERIRDELISLSINLVKLSNTMFFCNPNNIEISDTNRKQAIVKRNRDSLSEINEISNIQAATINVMLEFNPMYSVTLTGEGFLKLDKLIKDIASLTKKNRSFLLRTVEEQCDTSLVDIFKKLNDSMLSVTNGMDEVVKLSFEELFDLSTSLSKKAD